MNEIPDATITPIADPGDALTEFHPSNAVKYVLIGATALVVGAVIGVALAQVFDGSESEPKKRVKKMASDVAHEVNAQLDQFGELLADPLAAMADALPGEGEQQNIDPGLTMPEGVLTQPSNDTPSDLGI